MYIDLEFVPTASLISRVNNVKWGKGEICDISHMGRSLEKLETKRFIFELDIQGLYPTPDSPSSESSSRELTAEQSQIVNHKLQPGEVIKVMAFAGI